MNKTPEAKPLSLAQSIHQFVHTRLQGKEGNLARSWWNKYQGFEAMHAVLQKRFEGLSRRHAENCMKLLRMFSAHLDKNHVFQAQLLEVRRLLHSHLGEVVGQIVLHSMIEKQTDSKLVPVEQ